MNRAPDLPFRSHRRPAALWPLVRLILQRDGPASLVEHLTAPYTEPHSMAGAWLRLIV